uniref:Uncharacterized protein n=1 Tax=Anguilla anguilla TaxID=7936 RepID=A0A0E9RV09_ANGAN
MSPVLCNCIKRESYISVSSVASVMIVRYSK